MLPQQPLPTLGLLNATEEVDVRNDLNELRTFMPEALKDYVSIMKACGTILPAMTAGTYFLYTGQNRFISASAIGSASVNLSMDGFAYRWQPSFWGVPSGSQLKLRLKCNYTTGATAAGAIDFTVDMVTVTSVDFTTTTVARIGGFSGVTGSSFLLSSPPNSTFGTINSSDFAAPSSGTIALRIVTTGTMPTNAHIGFTIEVQKRVI